MTTAPTLPNPAVMPCVRYIWLEAIAAAALACVVSNGALAVSGSSQPSATAPAAAMSDPALREWEDKWRQIQHVPESVSLKDHWRVCDLKFRFRNYDELFRCLQLIEQRVAKLDEHTPQRRYTPVIVGWMRGSAYAELGDVDEALKWTQSAWDALPDDYHNDPATVFKCINLQPGSPNGLAGVALAFVEVGAMLVCEHKQDFARVATEAGGYPPRSKNDFARVGKNNPAGLDMRSQTIAMSLAAQRSVLHQQRGETELARQALQDLYKWRDATHQNLKVFEVDANRLAIGPLFGFKDYAGVIQAYDRSKPYDRSGKQSVLTKTGIVAMNVLSLGVAPALLGVNVREFATALEGTSTKYLYATSLARIGRNDQAEKVFDDMLAAPELRDMGSIYWAVLYERSQLGLRRGQRAEAIAFLQRAVDAIERVRTSITLESAKIGFAANKQTVYAALVSALAESGDWRGAFEAAERAKARALVDLLAQVQNLAPPPEASDKVRQLLASAEVNEGQLGFEASSETAETRNRVISAREELPHLAPETASLISVQTASLTDIAAKLASGERLLDYFHAGDDLYAFVVNGTDVKGFKLPAQGLDEQIRAFRAAIDTGTPWEIQVAGHALYERVLGPLAGAIPGRKLTISPHGALHYLPFAALLDTEDSHGNHFLIDRYSLRVIPSASALVYVKTDTPTKAGKLLALGNPDLGDARFDLPNAEREALEVAQMFPASRALVRQQASKTAVKELGSSFAILHFASHAMFNPDSPLSSGLYLAKGNEADGRLTVSDLYAMHLDVQLVTLSACETGLGKVLSGDDVMGLTRGFLYAGARSVVASLWSVDDAATAELMISFYQHLSSDGTREALRLAQLQTRQHHPEPRLWAAFEITGSGD